MNSIRRRLLVGLLGALTVTGFVAAAGVYLKARDEANARFDYQLKQIALSCAITRWPGLGRTVRSRRSSFRSGAIRDCTSTTHIQGSPFCRGLCWV